MAPSVLSSSGPTGDYASEVCFEEAPAVHVVSVNGDEQLMAAFLTVDFQRINAAYGPFVRAVRPTTLECEPFTCNSGITLWLRRPSEYLDAHVTTVHIVFRFAEEMGLLINLRGTELVYRDAAFHPVQSTVLKY